METSSRKRPFYFFCFILSLVTLSSFFQSICAQEQARDPRGEILRQEILQHEDPQAIDKAIHQIINEQNPAQKLELIFPWLQPNDKKNLTKEKQPYLWAMLHFLAAEALDKLQSIYRVDNLEQAIVHYTYALQVGTREAFPENWAGIQINLGVIYNKRIRGERADNLEQAIAHYENALKVYTREAYPEDWAGTQMNLGITYSDRVRGERSDNLEQAIAHYENALKVYTREAYPKDWAMTQNNLATAYSDRVRGERSDNLEQAIAHYENALKVYTREAYPEDWAMTQNNLAAAYSDRVRGERSDNLEQAIAHYEDALQVRTLEAYPEDWAMTQMNLGIVYSDRVRGERSDNLEQAIAHYEGTLQVRTREMFPKDWARTQNNLGVTYNKRIRGERTDNLEQAIAHYEDALQVRTLEAYPEAWAMTQMNLGIAYRDRIRGERADNLEKSIAHHNNALKVHTLEAYPEDWAMIQNNLANTYVDRIRGELTDNLEQAIAHYEDALQVRTLEAYPEDWAMTQMNLGVAYRDRIRGEREGNLEKSIAHHNNALKVRTREAYPEDWAMIQTNLANTYVDRIRGERADNLEQAIEHYENALKIYTREAYPEDWAMTQNNLATAYSDRVRGERSDNLEQAIAHYEDALQVRTLEAYPEDWAGTQGNLGIAYSDRVRGERSDNLEQAIAHYENALKVYTREAYPEEFIRTVTSLSLALLEIQKYSSVLPHLTAALEINETQLQQISFTPEERQRLIWQVQELFANAVWAATQLGDYVQAIRLLEWGKTRLLRQNLALDTVNLRKLPIKTQDKLRELQAEVSNLEIQLQSQANKLDSAIQTNLSAELKGKRQQLRETLNSSGITALQAPKDKAIRQWLAALTPGSALIAPIFSDFGTVVFVLPAATQQIGKSQVLVLPAFSRKDLRVMTRGEKEDEWGGYFQAYWNWTGEADASARKEKQAAWQNQLAASLDKLRVGVLKPVLAHLKELGVQPGARLFWLPDADSSLLPVHAAMVDGQPLLAQYTVQFVPSLYSAYTAQQRLAGNSGKRLLAVINPTENLDYASIEGELVSYFFANQTMLLGLDASAAKFNHALTGKPTYLHMSTHGSYQWLNPLESGLELAQGERLTLGNLLSKSDMLADNRLVVLSACETGLTDINAPAEALGLPAAFLQAGAPGVISTLWTVNEQSTTFLLGKFYQLHRRQNIEPPKALAQAQEWLRTATYQDLRDWLRTHMTEKTSPQFLPMMQMLEEFRSMATQEADNRPYQDPYYWAGFVYSGM